jgi:hypothetical protein
VTTPYQQVGDLVRCIRHGVTFDPRAAESCAGCAADPGPELDAPQIELPAPPRGCMSTEQIERWHVQEAKGVVNLRRKLTAKPARKKVATGKKAKGEPVLDLHAFNAAAKLQECAIKHMRAAAELASRREDEAIVKIRERLERQRERAGGTH